MKPIHVKPVRVIWAEGWFSNPLNQILAVCLGALALCLLGGTIFIVQLKISQVAAAQTASVETQSFQLTRDYRSPTPTSTAAPTRPPLPTAVPTATPTPTTPAKAPDIIPQVNTPVPVVNHLPVFERIDQSENFTNGQLVIDQNVYFRDADGDAYLIEYDLLSVSPDIAGLHVENDSINASSNSQMNGTYQTITWKCGTSKKTYTVRLQAVIVDRANHRSDPFAVIFECR